MATDDSELPTDFARRLWEVMAEEKKSPTRTEREANLQRGYMSQIKSGKIRSPGPDVIRALADYLHVGYEWLAIGRGAKRAAGWAPSALERATAFALANGARRDAIDAAVLRYRDEAEMTVMDWVLAFNTEATRLDRAGVQRPEVVETRHRTVRRLAKQDRELAERRKSIEAEISELENKLAGARDAASRAPATRSPAKR